MRRECRGDGTQNPRDGCCIGLAMNHRIGNHDLQHDRFHAPTLPLMDVTPTFEHAHGTCKLRALALAPDPIPLGIIVLPAITATGDLDRGSSSGARRHDVDNYGSTRIRPKRNGDGHTGSWVRFASGSQRLRRASLRDVPERRWPSSLQPNTSQPRRCRTHRWSVPASLQCRSRTTPAEIPLHV